MDSRLWCLPVLAVLLLAQTSSALGDAQALETAEAASDDDFEMAADASRRLLQLPSPPPPPPPTPPRPPSRPPPPRPPPPRSSPPVFPSGGSGGKKNDVPCGVGRAGACTSTEDPCCSRTLGICGNSTRFCGPRTGCMREYGFCTRPTGVRRQLLNLVSPLSETQQRIRFNRRFNQYETVTTSPKALDWRRVRAVTAVQNMSDYCLGCWAYASSSALESATFIFNGTLQALSEQQLLDCSDGRGDLTDPDAMGGCDGGVIEGAISWTTENGIARGSALAVAYPGGQVDINQACKDNSSVPRGSFPGGYAYLSPFNETELRIAVSRQPVIVQLHSSLSFQKYNGTGIYNDTTCAGDLDHAVVVIGYDSAQRYWLVRNMWSNTWGDMGVAKVAWTGDNTPGICGMYSTPPIYPVIRNQANPCTAALSSRKDCRLCKGKTDLPACKNCTYYPGGYSFNPCGTGTCTPGTGTNGQPTFSCACQPGTFRVVNADGTQTCIRDPCSDSVVDPCFYNSASGGSLCRYNASTPGRAYRCLCDSVGLQEGEWTSGDETCVSLGDGSAQLYTLQANDTCAGISAIYHISEDDLAALNGVEFNCSTLNSFTGKQILVGTYLPNLRCNKNGTRVVDALNVTCAALAAKASISVANLTSLNLGVNCTNGTVLTKGYAYCVAGRQQVRPPGFNTSVCDKFYTANANGRTDETCRSVIVAQKLTTDVFVSLNPWIICNVTVAGVSMPRKLPPSTVVCLHGGPGGVRTCTGRVRRGGAVIGFPTKRGFRAGAC